MNDNQITSIDLIKKLLDEMSNEEFLQMHKECEKNIGPKVDEVINYYQLYRGKCYEYCLELCEYDPNLILVRGYYHEPIWNTKEQHWWCKYPDGRIVDPTVKQFPSWQLARTNPDMFYEEFDGNIECAECGKMVPEEQARFDSRYAFCSSVCNMRFVGL